MWIIFIISKSKFFQLKKNQKKIKFTIFNTTLYNQKYNENISLRIKVKFTFGEFQSEILKNLMYYIGEIHR